MAQISLPPSVRARSRLVAQVALITGFSLTVAGCANDKDRKTDESGGFISHVPGGSRGGDDLDGGAPGGDGDLAVGDENAGDGDGDRVISEADIIKLDGNRLYALSQFSGLSIVDISDPTDLDLIGNYRSTAQPFEMYLEGSVAYVMYNGWYSHVYDEDSDSYRWETTSRMQAIDVSNPSDIKVIGDIEVPGAIADSRKVGDIIYLATHQGDYCWRCDSAANSRVTSFDVSDPTEFSQVDSEVFQTEDGWQRSISVTTDRIYVSGFTWSGDQNQGGTIDVVDISDASGALSKGDSVSIAGQIESRWQMDEFDGTLRVISQPGGWGTTNPPVVETFQVNSSNNIVPLASLDMVLPRPEDLRSVRFDGARAFAITFEQTDPLFTFDLSDPANPLQLGELEIPGWVYHMEPRGDRIYALGFDDTNDAGSLHVSLFDVSDMQNPVQLDRVNFGSDWGGFAEDQDRIHKAFNILSEEGLILVPFYGAGYDDVSCRYNYQSGIQLVDMTEDSLTLRGVAPQVGSARRALLHNGTLFGIGDNAVQSFDISDRDAPEKLDQLETARNISSIRLMGSTMLRFGSDWWTGQTMLDFTSLDDANMAEPLGELDLASFVEENSEEYCYNSGDYYYSYGYFSGQVFVSGNHAYVPRQSYSESYENDNYVYRENLEFFIVDISDRTSPELVGRFEVEPSDYEGGEYFAGIIHTEKALLVGRTVYSNDSVLGRGNTKFFYDVIDLSSPTNLEVVERLEVPSLWAGGGWGYGMGGCMIDVGWGWWGGYGGRQNALVSGDIVASQHQEPLNDGTGRVRYYLDRIDVSDPESPVLMPKINIPGNVVHFDAAEARVVTIDYRVVTQPAFTWDDCYNGQTQAEFNESARTCRRYYRRLNVLDLEGDSAVLRSTRDIDSEVAAGTIAISQNRIFYDSTEWNGEGVPQTTTITALSYDENGIIRSMGAVELPLEGYYYWGSLVARDGRAFLSTQNQLFVADATGNGVELTAHEMGGFWCNQLEVQNDVAYCAMGAYGVRSIPLD